MRGDKEETKYSKYWQIDKLLLQQTDIDDSERRDDRDDRDQQEDLCLLLQCRFTATNLEFIETVAQVERLVTTRSLEQDSHSSSDVALLTQQFCCLILSDKKASRFFNRVDPFDKIDQVQDRTDTNTAFRSIALFGLGDVGKSSIASYIKKKIEENAYDAAF
jgi:hypothetical protein